MDAATKANLLWKAGRVTASAAGDLMLIAGQDGQQEEERAGKGPEGLNARGAPEELATLLRNLLVSWCDRDCCPSSRSQRRQVPQSVADAKSAKSAKSGAEPLEPPEISPPKMKTMQVQRRTAPHSGTHRPSAG